jgi:hypothetical protein
LVLEVCRVARDLLRAEKKSGHHQRTARDEVLRGREEVNACGEYEGDWRTGKRARRCEISPGRSWASLSGQRRHKCDEIDNFLVGIGDRVGEIGVD